MGFLTIFTTNICIVKYHHLIIIAMFAATHTFTITRIINVFVNIIRHHSNYSRMVITKIIIHMASIEFKIVYSIIVSISKTVTSFGMLLQYWGVCSMKDVCRKVAYPFKGNCFKLSIPIGISFNGKYASWMHNEQFTPFFIIPFYPTKGSISRTLKICFHNIR